MYSRIPGSKPPTIPGAEHLANIERPKAFHAAVLAFLETLPSSEICF
jgi:pimeloyl-ACP methyl ester carboxylesterase